MGKGYGVSDLPFLVGNPAGRDEVRRRVYRRLWPLLRTSAGLHRRFVASDTRLVAVVGSFGKTTTARAIAAVLGTRRRPSGGYPNAFSSRAFEVLRIRRSDRHAVQEIGIDAPGQMVHYARMLRPDIVVVTSIGRDHQHFLPTLEVTRREKSKMLEALSPQGLAVINGDDANVCWMRERTTAPARRFGLGCDNDVRASEVRIDWPHGTRFTLSVGDQRREMRIRLLGHGGVMATLAAVTVGVAEGVTLDHCVDALARLEPTPQRLKPLALDGGAHLIDDSYKSGMETFESALDTLGEVDAARRILVFGGVTGESGSVSDLYRHLGRRSAEVASRVLFLSSKRRFKPFASGTREGGLAREEVVRVASVQDAIATLRDELRAGDVVLVKGRREERLERVVLGLSGRTVGCDLSVCSLKISSCEVCPMLERGFTGPRPSAIK